MSDQLDSIYLGGTPRAEYSSSSMMADCSSSSSPSSSSRRSLSFERAWITKLAITGAILASLALKVVSLIVFFSRMEVSLVITSPRSTSEPQPHKVFSDFITDFSFPQMMRDFYEAEAYLMCVLIALGSAAVPISKHVFMLLVWWIPASQRWHYVWRRRLLFLFDQTGKTALVDLFLIGYVICIFYTKVGPVHLAGGEITMLLQGEPVRGLFLASASMLLGNLLSHYLLVVHDLQAKGNFDRHVTVAVGPVSASLSNRLWIHSHSNKASLAWHVAIPLVILLGMVSLGMATQVELMSFHLTGLAGKFAQQDWRAFTVLTAPMDMRASSQSYYGTTVLAVMHVALALVLPVCLLVASAVLWFVPIELRLQRRLLSYFPLWFSWCTLDVFVVTSIAAYMEMHLVAEFTFDKNFPTLCSLVDRKLHAKCADLDQTLNWAGMVFCSAVCLVLFVLTVLVAVVGGNLVDTTHAAAVVHEEEEDDGLEEEEQVGGSVDLLEVLNSRRG